MKNEICCDICGKEGAKLKKCNRSFGKGSELIVIEEIPVIVCPHCGESYFTAETLQEVERIRIHKSSIAASSMAPVLSYP